MVSDEVAAVCPVTGQPDWYTVSIDYLPNTLCLESKSLKLYLQSFRNHGIFCEAFAETIANDLYEALAPQWVNVIVEQKPRGGITITARAVREMGDGNE
jgi:7-cyano-7-deazaguanine reductase